MTKCMKLQEFSLPIFGSGKTNLGWLFKVLFCFVCLLLLVFLFVCFVVVILKLRSD